MQRHASKHQSPAPSFSAVVNWVDERGYLLAQLDCSHAVKQDVREHRPARKVCKECMYQRRERPDKGL